MPIAPSVKLDKDDIIRFLLYQQFYYGDDKIYNRTKNRFELIPGAGDTIDKFYDLITKQIHFIDQGKIIEYLHFFHDEVFQINVDKINRKFIDNQQMLGESMDRTVLLTVIIGECLTEIHKFCFQGFIDNFLNSESIADNEILSSNNVDLQKKKIIESKLKELYALGNPTVGMIYSLCFFKYISHKVKKKQNYNYSSELLQAYHRQLSVILQD